MNANDFIQPKAGMHVDIMCILLVAYHNYDCLHNSHTYNIGALHSCMHMYIYSVCVHTCTLSLASLVLYMFAKCVDVP